MSTTTSAMMRSVECLSSPLTVNAEDDGLILSLEGERVGPEEITLSLYDGGEEESSVRLEGRPSGALPSKATAALFALKADSSALVVLGLVLKPHVDVVKKLEQVYAFLAGS